MNRPVSIGLLPVYSIDPSQHNDTSVRSSVRTTERLDSHGSGNIQGGVRPVINIQNNSGNFFGPTLIVVSLTTELKKLGQPTHYVIEKQRGLDETFMSEAEQIVTINKCQVFKYLGCTSNRNY